MSRTCVTLCPAVHPIPSHTSLAVANQELRTVIAPSKKSAPSVRSRAALASCAPAIRKSAPTTSSMHAAVHAKPASCATGFHASTRHARPPSPIYRRTAAQSTSMTRTRSSALGRCHDPRSTASLIAFTATTWSIGFARASFSIHGARQRLQAPI